MTGSTHGLLRRTLPFVVACCLSFGIFYLSYHFDNKYTAGSPQAMGGVLFLDRGELEQSPVVYLINGWELYRDRLLTPEDFSHDAPSPDQYTAIGQYGGFESEADANPHGSATYRLNLLLPEQINSYTLELPEIYSAYRLYVNDTLVVSRGNPDPDAYRPRIQSGSISFQAAGNTVLTIAVSDFSHLYSGMVYPPAFGKPEAVASVLDGKFAFSLTVCCVALLVGLLCFFLSCSLKNRRFLLFALLCLCSIGSVGYPAVHRLFSFGVQPWYALEIAADYAMFLLFVLLVNSLCDIPPKITAVVASVGGFFCVLAFGVSMASAFLSYPHILAFSNCTAVYKIICAVWILSVAAAAVLRKTAYSGALLTGSGVFACALLADRIFPLFEPIHFGWFTELAEIWMLAVVGYILCADMITAERRRLAFEQQHRQMETRIQMQKEHYRALAGQMEQISQARHDLRHHLTALQLYLQEGHVHDALAYINTLHKKPELSSELSFCTDYNLDVLLRYYDAEAKANSIRHSFRVQLPADLKVSAEDICVMIGNLLENAVEACRKAPQEGRFLSVKIFHFHSNLMIEVKNSYAEKLFPQHALFSSTKRQHIGMGLKSIQTIAEKYHGNLTVHAEENEHTFIAQVFLINRPASTP